MATNGMFHKTSNRMDCSPTLFAIDVLRVISVGSGTGMAKGSEAGIGSVVFFFVFFETFFCVRML